MTASEMRMKSNMSMDDNEVLQKFWSKAEKVIEDAAQKGNCYVCFYDCCHPCDNGYSRDVENMLINKLKQNGFKITEKWRIFGGNQITPYIVW